MIKRFLSGLLSALMVLALVSCGGGTDQPAETTVNNVPSQIHCTVTVKIGATDKKGEEVLIDNLPIILRDRTEWPTILDALAQACYAYEIKYSASADGSTVGAIKNHKNFENNCFWEWTKNGKAPGEGDGKAGDTLVTDGDVYVFTYVWLGGASE